MRTKTGRSKLQILEEALEDGKKLANIIMTLGETQATGSLSSDPNIPYEGFVNDGPYNQGPVAGNEAQSIFNRLAAAWAQQQKNPKEKK